MTFIVTRQRAQEVHDRARARAGLPYAYGGAFTEDPRRSTDCSGLVLQTAAWYDGRTDWPGNRYGSTESFRLDHRVVYDLGFKRMPAGGPGTLPFKPVMLVGLQHGGGGENSHTACTLMTMDIPGGPVVQSERGVDWESRGGNPGVFLYDGARAWNDRLFHDFWYLDAKLEDAAAGRDEDQVDVLVEATGLTPARAAEVLPQLRGGLIASECTNPLRIAMWIAQVGHESDDFNATEEYDDGANHGDPNETTDRWKYKGRTWIQITWSYNYADFSRWCASRGLVDYPTYFLDHPRELADQKWAGLGPAWYWTVQRKDINALCDAGDVETVSKRINGTNSDTGRANHIEERIARYRRALALGDRLLALVASPTPTDPFEELFVSNPRVPSASIYATPGEPDVPIVDMIRALDAHGPHEPYVEAQARAGDPDALVRVARTAAGKGTYGAAPGPVAQAQAVLDDIEKTNPAVLQAFLAQNGASK